MEQKSVIIIGAGIGGLGLACLLGKKGYKVTVVEKNEAIGGRARILKDQGFTFDMGPSWYMMPEVFEHFFSLMGEKVSDYYTLERLSPSYRIFLKSDGKHYDFYSDIVKNRATFEMIEPGSGKVLDEFLAMTKAQYEIAYSEFMFKNYDSIFDFFNKRVMTLGRTMPIFKKQKSIIESRFKSEILQKVMQYQMILLGTAPGDCPGIYSMMNYVDFVEGVWYPSGGIMSVPQSLEKMAKKHGVMFRISAPVSSIMVSDNHAHGVTLETGEVLTADIVVSNADIVHTDQRLLPKQYRQHTQRYWNKRLLAPSAFILYLGIEGEVPSLSHHNLLFSKNWEEGFDQVFHHPAWPADPSMYVCAPSKTDTTVAPAGDENLFVLVPIAPGLVYDDTFEKEYTEKILSELETYAGVVDIRQRIKVQHTYSIKNFAADYNAFKGTALGLAHTLTQTSIFRPNNVHKKIKNLFYVGAGTNPGIGMPICLISAELAYKRIEQINSPHPLAEL